MSIEGTTIGGEEFHDRKVCCPSCGHQGLKNRISINLEPNQEWNIEQYVDLELQNFNVELECPICGWQGSQGINRAIVHKRV